MATWCKYTEEVLRDAVAASTSVAGVLRHLGIGATGGAHAHISRRIKAFNIDTSHFIRYQNGAHRLRLSPEAILVRRPPGSPRTKPPLLRRALWEIGLAYRCVLCGNQGEWLGAALRLEVDHVDGDYLNNERNNLRFLCPNCHTQTDSYAGRSRGKSSIAAGLVPAPRPIDAPQDL